MQVLWIAIGSALGGTLRYALDQLSILAGGGSFPISTFIINISGSFLIGYLAGLWGAGSSKQPDPKKWHFWMTGVCGGYTTFSAFSWQVLELVESGHGQLAGFYAALSIVGGLFAVWFGLSLAAKKREAASS